MALSEMGGGGGGLCSAEEFRFGERGRQKFWEVGLGSGET